MASSKGKAKQGESTSTPRKNYSSRPTRQNTQLPTPKSAEQSVNESLRPYTSGTDQSPGNEDKDSDASAHRSDEADKDEDVFGPKETIPSPRHPSCAKRPQSGPSTSAHSIPVRTSLPTDETEAWAELESLFVTSATDPKGFTAMSGPLNAILKEPGRKYLVPYNNRCAGSLQPSVKPTPSAAQQAADLEVADYVVPTGHHGSRTKFMLSLPFNPFACEKVRETLREKDFALSQSLPYPWEINFELSRWYHEHGDNYIARRDEIVAQRNAENLAAGKDGVKGPKIWDKHLELWMQEWVLFEATAKAIANNRYPLPTQNIKIDNHAANNRARSASITTSTRSESNRGRSVSNPLEDVSPTKLALQPATSLVLEVDEGVVDDPSVDRADNARQEECISSAAEVSTIHPATENTSPPLSKDTNVSAESEDESEDSRLKAAYDFAARDTRLLGVDVDDVPPKIAKMLNAGGQAIFALLEEHLTKHATRDNASPGLLMQLDPEIRILKKASEARPLVNIDNRTMAAAFHDTFGEFGGIPIGTRDLLYMYADRPPGVDAKDVPPGFTDNYQRHLKSAGTFFKEVFQARDHARYTAARTLDLRAKKDLAFMLQPRTGIMGFTSQQILQHFDNVIAINHKYNQMEWSKPDFLKEGTALFLARAESYLQGSASDVGVDPEIQDLIRGFQEQAGISVEIAMENKRRSEDNAQYPASTTINPKLLASEVDLGNREYGVSAYTTNGAPWDSWDCIEHLGLMQYQDDTSIDLASEKTASEAHEFVRNEKGEPELDPVTGEYQWVYPEHHRARTQVRIPFLQPFAAEARDPVAWENKVNGTIGAVSRSDETHNRLYPSSHQLIAVCRIMDIGYANHPKIQKMTAQYLADAVGLGKTLTFILVLCILRYHEANPTMISPCQEAVKANLLPSDMDEMDRNAALAIRTKKAVWGPGRSRSHNHKIRSISLLAASKSVSTSHGLELKKWLEPSEWVVRRVDSESSIAGRTRRAAMVNEIETALKNRSVILLCTYDSLRLWNIAIPIDRSIPNPMTYETSIYRHSWRYRFLIFDEIHEYRDPGTSYSAAIQRISSHAEFRLGASATPVFTSPADFASAMTNLLAPEMFGEKRGLDDTREVDLTIGSEWCNTMKKEQDRLHRLRRSLDKKYASAQEYARRSEIKEETEDEKLVEFFSTDMNPDPEYMERLRVDDSPKYTLVTGRIELLRQFFTFVINPIRRHLDKYLIRRIAQSPNHLGLPIVQIVAPEAERVILRMPPKERRAYDLFAVVHKKDGNFRTAASLFLIDPFYVVKGFYDPSSEPGVKLNALIDLIRPIEERNQRVPEMERVKWLVYTGFVKTLPSVRARLAQAGIRTSEIHGGTGPAERSRRQVEFQATGPHLSQPISYAESDTAVQTHPSSPCYGMVFTSIGATGLNLQRASVLFFLDVTWSAETDRQIEGRIVRQGQTRDVRIVKLVVEDSVDTWKERVNATKGQLAEILFDVGKRDPSIIAEVEDQPILRSSAPLPTENKIEQATKVLEEKLETARLSKIALTPASEKIKKAFKAERKRKAEPGEHIARKKVAASKKTLRDGEDGVASEIERQNDVESEIVQEAEDKEMVAPDELQGGTSSLPAQADQDVPEQTGEDKE